MRAGGAAAIVGAGLVAAVGLVGPTPAHADPPAGCEPPRIVREADLSLGPSTGLPAAYGGTLPTPTADTHAALDMDADQVPDVVTRSGTTLTVERSDGTLTITDIPSVIALGEGPAADLDGDGGDELWIAWPNPGSVIHLTAVVPSTLPPGTRTFDDATLIFGGTIIGDVNGDGLPDAHVAGPVFPGTRSLFLPWSNRSLVGAFSLQDGAIAGFGTWTDQTAVHIDLDHDGRADRVMANEVQGPGHTTFTSILFSRTAPRTVFPDGVGGLEPAAMGAFRRGSASYVDALWTRPWGVDVTRYRVIAACAAPWAAAIGPAVVGRSMRASDLGAALTDDPLLPARRAALDRLTRTPDGRRTTVSRAYLEVLGRTADPAGLHTWTTALADRRASTDSLRSALAGSPEAVRRAGSEGRYVAYLYSVALGRTPDAAGEAYWLGQLRRSGAARTAAMILASDEARRHRVRSLYQEILGRPADAGGLAARTATLVEVGEDAARSALLASDERYLAAQRPILS